MTSSPLRELEQCGQSVWLDSISRDLLHSLLDTIEQRQGDLVRV